MRLHDAVEPGTDKLWCPPTLCNGVSWCPTRCCEANTITAERLWKFFRAEANVMDVGTETATVIVSLYFLDSTHEHTAWKLLQWQELAELHGRRVHASVVDTDLKAAWHLHPVEPMAAEETQLTFTLPMRFCLASSCNTMSTPSSWRSVV